MPEEIGIQFLSPLASNTHWVAWEYLQPHNYSYSDFKIKYRIVLITRRNIKAVDFIAPPSTILKSLVLNKL